MHGLKRKLLDKSIEAYVLSLETINRLSIKYRVETFAYLICNAWELLLKAKIILESGKNSTIYYKKKRGENRRSLSLRDCLKNIFTNENDSIRRNVEYVADLRDEAVHMVIAEVPKDLLSLFQACVLNYNDHLKGWFGVSIADRVSVGMMTIIYDFAPERFDLGNPEFRRRLGRTSAEYLAGFQATLRKEFVDLGKPPSFFIDINYKLALVKDPKVADIVLSKGEGGYPTGIVEVPKDPCRTHPYRCKDVVERINAGLDGVPRINNHDILSVVRVHRVRQRPEFFYRGAIKGSPPQYSPTFEEWLLRQLKNDPAFFSKAREKVRLLHSESKGS